MKHRHKGELDMKKNQEYNYQHMSTSRYSLAFDRFDGPRIGELAPDFTVYTLEGKIVRLRDYLEKTVILETGSITCPATIGNTKSMQDLMARYSEMVFLLLYVREAHPGQNIPAHDSLENKIHSAQRLKDEENENRIIIVDNLEGDAHKAYGLLPDMVYVIDKNGYVIYRAQWNNPDRLDEVLRSIHEGKTAQFEESYEFPSVKNVGFRAFKNTMFRTIKRAGPRAITDMLLTMPSLLLMRLRLQIKKYSKRTSKK